MKSLFLFFIVFVVCLPPLSGAGFCSPFTSKKENIIQFCGGQQFDGTDLQLDTFEASTRKTICDCSFKIKNSTLILLSTKTSPVQTTPKCDITSSRIEYKIAEETSISGTICDYAAKQIDIRSGQTLQVTFYNELVNLENYCLNVNTNSELHTFKGMCFSDGFTTTEPSTHSSKENKVTVDEKEQEAYTSDTRRYKNKDSTTTSYTSTGYQSTSNANASLYLKILLPSVCCGLLFITIVVTAVVYFIKRKKTHRKSIQNESIRRVSDNDQTNHKEHAPADKASRHTVTNTASGHVIELDTGDTDEYSIVSPHNTLTAHRKNNIYGAEDAGTMDRIQDDTKTMNSEPRSDYEMLNKDLQNCKEKEYTFLDPGSVYVMLNKNKNNEKEQDYTSLKSESVCTSLYKHGNNEKEQEYESLEPAS